MEQPNLSYRPLYQQIKDVLLQRIVSGEWAPGTFIPSESALANEYKVSVGTLRKALDSLASDNVVIRYQGKGTVVATHDQDSSLFRFFHLTRLDGTRSLPTSRILVRTKRQASEQEREALALAHGAEVIHIQRVRELEGTPALLEDVVVCAKRFATLDSHPETLPNTLYQLYQQRFGSNVSHAEERLFAVAASKDEQTHLGIAEGTPILEIRRIAKDIQDQALEYRVSRCETRQHCYFNEL